MAQIDKSTFETTYVNPSGTFADNTTREISEADLRQFADHIADSLVFLDGVSGAPPTYPGITTGVLSSLASGTFYKRTDVSSAQILSGNSSPITCVAAPTSGYMIVPVAFHISMDYNSAAYATNTTFRFEINGVAVSNTNTTLLPGTADRFVVMQAIDIDTTTSLVTQPLLLEVQTGNPTAGNSNWTVGVIYRIVWGGIGVEP